MLWSGMLCVFKQQLLRVTKFLREKPGRSRVVELICAITISLSKSFVDEQRSTQRRIKQNEAAQTVYHSHRVPSSGVWDWPRTNLSGATSGKQNSKRKFRRCKSMSLQFRFSSAIHERGAAAQIGVAAQI